MTELVSHEKFIGMLKPFHEGTAAQNLDNGVETFPVSNINQGPTVTVWLLPERMTIVSIAVLVAVHSHWEDFK